MSQKGNFRGFDYDRSRGEQEIHSVFRYHLYSLFPWLRPRRSPEERVGGRDLWYSLGVRVKLSGKENEETLQWWVSNEKDPFQQLGQRPIGTTLRSSIE